MSTIDPERLAKQAEHIRALARRLVFDTDAADDLVQDACLAALRRPPETGVPLRAWLVGVARNLAARRHRDTRRRRRALEALAARQEALLSEDVDRRARLHRELIGAVQRLPEPYATTLLLRYFDGLPPRVIAVRMGVPAATVSTRIHRGLERLRAQLGEGEGGQRRWLPALLPLAARPDRGSTLVLFGAGGLVMGMKSWLAVAAGALLCAFLLVGPYLGDEPDGASRNPDASPDLLSGVGLEGRSASLPAAGAPRERADPLAQADRHLDLHGRVVDPKGRPIGGATVETYTFPWQRATVINLAERDIEVPGPSAVTAHDGTFAIRLRRGTEVNVRVRAEGHVQKRVPDCLAGERLEVVMTKGVRLRTRTIDASGAAVAGASVRAWTTAASGLTMLEWKAKTDARGSVEFHGLAPGVRTTIEASHPRHATPRWHALYPRAGSNPEVVLTLPTGRTIRGRVLDAASGEPVPAARVGQGWTLHKSVEVDADGSYAFHGYLADGGRPDLYARAAGYPSVRTEPPYGEVVDIRLTRGILLYGRVVNHEKQPVAGAYVAAVGGSYASASFDRTEADGTFRLDGLRAKEPHVLIAYAPGHGRMVHDVVTLPEGEHAVGDVMLPRPQAIEGTVVRPDGTPAAGITVELRGSNANRDWLQPGTGVASDRTGNREVRRADDLGRFRFPDLAAGAYSLQVQPPDRKWSTTQVELREGAGVQDVALSLVGGHVLRVRVQDDAGAPVPGVNVDVRCEDLYTFGQFTGMSGTFDLDSDSPFESVDVSVSFQPNAWILPPSRTLEPGTKNVVIVLRRAGRVRGRVLEPDGQSLLQRVVLEVLGDGKPVVQQTNFMQNQLWTNAEGRFKAVVPLAGDIEIRATERVQPDGTIWGGRVAVQPGDENVELRMVPLPLDRALAVRALRPDGRPAADIQVYARVAGVLVKGANVRTNAEGRGRLEGLPAGRVSLFARPTDETPDTGTWLPWVRSAVEPSGQVIEIRFVEARFFAGRVVDAKGAPVAGVSVSASHGMRPPMNVTTDADGRFVLRLHPEETGPLHVFAALGMRRVMVNSVDPETESFEMKLPD